MYMLEVYARGICSGTSHVQATTKSASHEAAIYNEAVISDAWHGIMAIIALEHNVKDTRIIGLSGTGDCSGA